MSPPSNAPLPHDQTQRVYGFWNERAQEFGSDQRATLAETYLRDIEIRAMLAHLHRLNPRNVLDVGCGNGYSTKIYARALPGTQFVGVDFSEGMLSYAEVDRPPNCNFALGDLTDPATLPTATFDVVYTQRCIQNLPDYETQCAAIQDLLSRRTPGGTLILNECSRSGVEQLNRWRRHLGRKPIENIEPWHNCFLIDAKLRDDFHAEIECISSTYMFLAKVIHPRLSRLAAQYLPAVGQFGYDRFYVIRN